MDDRPKPDEYFMGIAIAVRRRANCLGNRVGAVIVRDRRIVSTGYNGTPENMDNCLDGGCDRCSNRGNYESGKGYDLCICVHAEQNALLSAARHGIAVQGGTMYSTMRPCFGCTKELLQARVQAVYFLHDWAHPEDGEVVVFPRYNWWNNIVRIAYEGSCTLRAEVTGNIVKVTADSTF